MEFDHLNRFYHVARLKSFTAAAAHLYLSQPAVSQQVKALEKELGEALFERSGRNIRLTRAGELLYEETKELMERFHGIQEVVSGMRSLQRGRLTLGASDTVSLHFLPNLLQGFLREHEGIELRIQCLVSREVVQRVKDFELDLGIVTLPLVDAQIETLPLFEEGFVAVVPPEHSLAKQRIVSPPDFAQERLILLERDSQTRFRIEEYLGCHATPSKPVMELSNFEIIKRYVASGLGVSLVPEGAVSALRDGVEIVPLETPLSFRVGIVWRRDRTLSPAADAFRAAAREHFGAG